MAKRTLLIHHFLTVRRNLFVPQFPYWKRKLVMVPDSRGCCVDYIRCSVQWVAHDMCSVNIDCAHDAIFIASLGDRCVRAH